MGLRIQSRQLLTSNRKRVAVFLGVLTLVLQPVLSSNIPAVFATELTGSRTVNNIKTYDTLKDALADTTVKYVNLAPNATIVLPSSLLLTRNDVKIDGNGSTLSRTNTAGWLGEYAIKVWGAKNTRIENLGFTGGDAAVLVASSNVAMSGNIQLGSHEFGGIEVSQGTGLVDKGALTLNGTMTNSSEATGDPSVWVVNGQGSFNPGTQQFTKATHVNPNQTQYYLQAANTGAVATNTTKGTTHTSLQAAIDAATAGDVVELNKDVTLSAAVQVNKPVTINGAGKKLTTAWTDVYNGNNGALVITANDVTVNNLVVNGLGTYKLHGINVSSADGVKLNNITATNSSAGVNIGYSTVDISGITTSGNEWYGVGLDKDSRVTAVNTVKHEDAVHVMNDNTDNSVFTGNQYIAVANNGVKREYKFATLAAPTNLSWKATGSNTPVANQGITNAYEGTVSWNAVADTSGYVYKYWNDIAGDAYHAGNKYIVPVSGTSRTGGFTQGEGVHHICVAAVDFEGKESACTQFTITYDKTLPSAPELVTESPYIANGLNKTLQWNPSESDDVDYYEYAEYNNTAPADANSTPSWLKEVDGTTTTDTAWGSDVKIYWRVRAVDTAGNKGQWSETRLILTDKTKPTVSASNEPSVNPQSITITASDNFGVKQVVGNIYRVGTDVALKNNKVFDANTLTVDLSNLGDGAYFVRYNARDYAGTSSKTYDFNFTVDTKVNAPTVAYSNNGETTSDPVTVTMTFDENVTPADTLWSTTNGKVFTRTFTSNTSGSVMFEDDNENKRTVSYVVEGISVVSEGPLFAPTTPPATAPVQNRAQSQQSRTTAQGPLFVATVNNGSTATPVAPTTPTEDSGDVLGLSSTDPKRTTAAVAGASDKAGWSLGDMAWYWWVAIVAGLVALWLLFAAALRRFRGNEA